MNNEVPAESGVVLDAGSRLVLTCEGVRPVNIIPRLTRSELIYNADRSSCNVMMQKVTFKVTGTYMCVYIGMETSNFSSVHIFVRGECRVYVWTFGLGLIDLVTMIVFIMNFSCIISRF